MRKTLRPILLMGNIPCQTWVAMLKGEPVPWTRAQGVVNEQADCPSA
eukprot:CAMPEP_0174351564 /NCGR_PEP_ID=MMETSP0811_2-20130205/8973_1 /TAXON_ID=73025 ORGANISM="Eutreptiella gymnastica-like, Strain CCMP1594" /NCGR_SAMPLE_ID=MMETSP0811_2 /ASSEMBLY_ACC=CAM_ASM_000667 /LENGTH=46 /DNA_ID= /DNA_START= /DNA_END= /DNA_ORIENTATION=